MKTDPLLRLSELLTSWNFSPFWADITASLVIVVVAVLVTWLVWWLTTRVVLRILEKIVRRTKATWDDELLNSRFFYRLSWLAPALIIRITAPVYLHEDMSIVGVLVKGADLAIIVSVVLAIVDLLNLFNRLYSQRGDSNRRPIKGLIQAVQVLVITAGVILAYSTLAGKPIGGLMAGLGAVSAVLMIVFQEPIKGLAAGFQLSSNDMVRIGDWIEMPSQGADGDVIDISLLNVTVRNWDRTYVTFPIQALTGGAFKNWRGMSESGGRRIKRSLNIDLSTIRFLDTGEVGKLKSIAILSDYLDERGAEIDQWNDEHHRDREASPVNGRALTNIGVFRAYARAYLSGHPKTHTGMTLLVRQLQSGPEGLPIELYVFSSDTAWANYEDIQADIFDHLLAVLPEFGLKVYQKPSGEDIRRIPV